MVLIDTDIFIDYLRNFQPAIYFFNELTESDEIFFSAITETELIAGSANNNAEKKEVLLRFLSRWIKIDVDNKIAVLAGDLARTHKLEVPDAIIAASAIINETELITHNINDFKKIKELKVKSPY